MYREQTHTLLYVERDCKYSIIGELSITVIRSTSFEATSLSRSVSLGYFSNKIFPKLQYSLEVAISKAFHPYSVSASRFVSSIFKNISTLGRFLMYPAR